MKATELVELLNRSIDMAGNGNPLKVVVQVVRSEVSVGGTPRVEISGISAGFDWNNGVLFLHADELLTALTAEELADVRKHAQLGQNRQAYAMYQRCKALEQEVKTLKEQLDVRSTESQSATDPSPDDPSGIPGRSAR